MSSPAVAITIRLYSTLREKFGCEIVQCEARTVKDALNYLKKHFPPEAAKAAVTSHIFLNTSSIAFLKGVRTPVRENDVIHILPPAGGG